MQHPRAGRRAGGLLVGRALAAQGEGSTEAAVVLAVGLVVERAQHRALPHQQGQQVQRQDALGAQGQGDGQLHDVVEAVGDVDPGAAAEARWGRTALGYCCHHESTGVIP